MKILSAKFIASNVDPQKCPAPNMPEYALIGRSNVGKSSLINFLLAKNDLAKTSAKPGKTQHINHFLVNDFWYLVDLPGYGYATIGKDKRLIWEEFIRNYILTRKNLMCLMVLIESKLEPQTIDLEFMSWLGENNIPFVMVFTKIDKLSKAEYKKKLASYQAEMLKKWESLPGVFHTSSDKKIGATEILKYIEETNAHFNRAK